MVSVELTGSVRRKAEKQPHLRVTEQSRVLSATRRRQGPLRRQRQSRSKGSKNHSRPSQYHDCIYIKFVNVHIQLKSYPAHLYPVVNTCIAISLFREMEFLVRVPLGQTLVQALLRNLRFPHWTVSCNLPEKAGTNVGCPGSAIYSSVT